MQSAAAEFSHEEIWDDSALVNSWNQALEEYKKYHSIHAKGGSVNDIPAEPQQPTQPRDAKLETRQDGDVFGVDDEREDTVSQAARERDQGAEASQDDSRAGPGHLGLGAGQGAALGGPHELLGTVEDDELKKLLMSWYWAGYYTATYQAKQKQDKETGRE